MENKTLNTSILSFPIIAFAKGNVIHFVRVKEDITTCTKVALKGGFFKDLQLVDSNGIMYKIEDAKKVGTIGNFWGYNIFLNQKLKVELLLKSKSRIELEELKERLLKALRHDQYFWNSDGNLKERTEFIKNANSSREIIERLSNEFYKEYK